MFTLKEFNETCKIFAKYGQLLTPLQLIGIFRENPKRDKEVILLSNVFEKMPGNATLPINDFIDVMRLKIIVR